MSSLTFKPGDIIVAPIPFSSQATAKIRPAIVMSPQKYNARNEDLVVFKITGKGRDYPFEVLLSAKDVSNGTLTKESVIQIDFPVVVDQQSVTQHIGNITAQKIAEVKQKIKEFYELK